MARGSAGCSRKVAMRTSSPQPKQVRQPIFRDGLDQWKKYEPWLTPLRDALGEAVSAYRRPAL